MGNDRGHTGQEWGHTHLFTIEELTIIKICWDPRTSRDGLLHELESIRPIVGPSQMVETITALLDKLRGLSDAGFASLDLSQALQQ